MTISPGYKPSRLKATKTYTNTYNLVEGEGDPSLVFSDVGVSRGQQRSGEDEALHGLAGEFGDEFKVLVEVQDCKFREPGGGGDDEIRN